VKNHIGADAGVNPTVVASLVESMRAVQYALMQPGGLPPEQLSSRIQEWQQQVAELSGGTVEGAELATLYEIIRVLNSSLNLTETLGLVMDSLIHLTGAERACLVLLDDEGNLETRAAQHFDQDSVDASDLELSHTVVEEAMESGQPVLTTNAQRDPRFSGRESVVGYQLRSIVCVPLHVRERVIGALYLDNRMRSGVFSEADMPILTAFANQAAVAIENARLYTMTDLALAARLDELTTLQQIDRELNASLDVERVLDLALSWALKATGAARGMLSILDEERSVCAASGVGDDVGVDWESDAVQQAMAGHEAVITGGTRMLVPVRYEDRAMGLLDLQTGDGVAFSNDHAQFAGRLADHAAVAIQNARLYEQVRQADRAKSEFVSFVAHELRTPMTSIRGYAEMLEKGMAGSLGENQMSFVHTITRNVQRMQILVSDLQDVSRIETGQIKLNVTSADLPGALENALQATQGQIEARSQQLTVDVPEGLPLVRADPARLVQILINLLSNAYKYTPEGGRIRVQAWLQDEHVHCAVSDDGIGISPEDRACLFTKFFRSESQAVREVPGTGLGLCIVKSLVELQGGEIEVETEIGKGSTFTFSVPVATAEVEEGEEV